MMVFSIHLNGKPFKKIIARNRETALHLMRESHPWLEPEELTLGQAFFIAEGQIL